MMWNYRSQGKKGWIIAFLATKWPAVLIFVLSFFFQGLVHESGRVASWSFESWKEWLGPCEVSKGWKQRQVPIKSRMSLTKIFKIYVFPIVLRPLILPFSNTIHLGKTPIHTPQSSLFFAGHSSHTLYYISIITIFLANNTRRLLYRKFSQHNFGDTTPPP